jgi:hypothetical protein
MTQWWQDDSARPRGWGVYLKQSIHGEGLGHISEDLVQAALLRMRELEGQRSLCSLQQRCVCAAAALRILLVSWCPADGPMNTSDDSLYSLPQL